MIHYDTLKNWPFKSLEHTYTARDAMLYALGLGYGIDPLDRDDLHYVHERELRVSPTFANVLGYPGFWAKDPRTGIDWVKLLHGEQTLHIHQPLPPAATVIGQSRVARIVDKGAGKGALLLIERTIREKESGTLLATVEQLNFLRGDGGYSANGQPSDGPLPSPPPLPERGPDAVCDLPTRPESALIYRLSGDYNPIHADPNAARAAGFERPILHGLATYGVAAHAVLKTSCESRPERLAMFFTRFTAPVYPGETIRTELWIDGKTVGFRSRALERDVVVLNNGRAELR
ncbi:3-alpha,7-alpha,12-alpha-trihydroxy-5-beta-cholest-24-enoyl-CoA hydratase [Trinickia violacea]|uniref:3-alpha,7-alpha, 12-alpha-trihydroxy-5-beta-cholest-24-enoyl-CoA hydratase n=1 Tax=Trinickia violacea TaxID=2571746 RepID=A0A4V1EHL6_9BURK|nr:MaoC/PaaZ C-terminal domain-containing protein [Trinickia violacea]QCP50700.1 3-alpha,7-alpha,12-alpha-trihydroxy-5-beta-cholest-24-enoyl-CoA hydratase [Trinickia violacea]